MSTIAQFEKPNQSIEKSLVSPNQLAEFTKALPATIKAAAFARIALTTIKQKEAFSKCEPRTLIAALMQCAQLGLPPDGRRVHLIPFGQTVNVVIGYQGLLELARNTGLVSTITVEAVKDNDVFEWDTGEIKHKIDFRNPRGEAYAYYAICTFKDGSKQAAVMTADEIVSIRDRSQSYLASQKYGKDSPWTTSFDEMAKKTVFRRLAKWLTLSSERFDAAVEIDNDDFKPAQVTVTPSFPSQAPQLSNEHAANESVIVDPIPATAPVTATVDTSTLGALLSQGKVSLQKFVEWLKSTNRLASDIVVASLDDVPAAIVSAVLADNAKLLNQCIALHGSVLQQPKTK
jgi:recombination protein RecT